MNTLTTLTAAIAIAAGAFGLAHAQAVDEVPLTRAQVLAELDAARASGELGVMAGEDSGSFWLAQQAQPSTLSRQQVMAGVRDSLAQGALNVLVGEDSGSMHFARAGQSALIIYAGPNVGERPESRAATPAGRG